MKIQSFSISMFDDHYETPDGLKAEFPVVGVRTAIRLDPVWRIELRHFRGTSAGGGGFSTSIGDFEGRIAHRLDNPHEKAPYDGLGRNLYAWVSWRIWTSHQFLNGVQLDPERDEGLGFGLVRDPMPQGLSYWYNFGLYPSVRTSLAKQADAFNIDAGLSEIIGGETFFTLGYRFQAIRTDTRHARGQEQGFLVGLKANF